MKKRIGSIGSVLAALLALAPPIGSAGAPTWRCGNVYTDRPCAGGKPIDVDDGRSVEQQRDADVAAREAQDAATRMERERVRFEARNARRDPIVLDSRSKPTQPASQAAAASKHKKKKAKKDEPEYFSARAPGSGKKSKAP
ncbi:MAG: hypothetical protein KKC85_10865 [Gammaproteobacteria bacterium]|nr:hypothetical protein [Gammaproteobacteria bacterium]MBU1442615.1 hypothetical protein [Gammaproteobacteria bacterium]MBU2286924.1 hypothetical protein [Gammaproteobacteria bacterium]